MTHAVVRSPSLVSGAAFLCKRCAALLGRSLSRVAIAHATHRALDELPDNLLRDIGLTRSEIPFVAGDVASGYGASMRETLLRR